MENLSLTNVMIAIGNKQQEDLEHDLGRARALLVADETPTAEVLAEALRGFARHLAAEVRQGFDSGAAAVHRHTQLTMLRKVSDMLTDLQEGANAFQ